MFWFYYRSNYLIWRVSLLSSWKVSLIGWKKWIKLSAKARNSWSCIGMLNFPQLKTNRILIMSNSEKFVSINKKQLIFWEMIDWHNLNLMKLSSWSIKLLVFAMKMKSFLKNWVKKVLRRHQRCKIQG